MAKSLCLLLLIFPAMVICGCQHELSPVDSFHQLLDDYCSHYDRKIDLMQAMASIDAVKSKSGEVRSWIEKESQLERQIILAHRELKGLGVGPDNNLVRELAKRWDATRLSSLRETKRIDKIISANNLYKDDERLSNMLEGAFLPHVEKNPFEDL